MKKQAITLLLILAGFANTYAQSYPEMVAVAGGTFTMGDTEMKGDKDELPAHQVTLKTFKIAKTETTVAQWRAFCSAADRAMPQAPNGGWIDNHPIINVNYGDAVAYCDWLAEKLDANYRLPTEAEWEYAARGGNKSQNFTYSGSNDLNEVAWWYSDKTVSKTQTVGRKKANELGIFDMSGNVWEWCNDWWFFEYNRTAETNPEGVTSGTRRIVRGGSWYSLATTCRVACRDYCGPSYRTGDTGFRVVLSL